MFTDHETGIFFTSTTISEPGHFVSGFMHFCAHTELNWAIFQMFYIRPRACTIQRSIKSMDRKNFRQVGRTSTAAASRANGFALRKERPKNPSSSSIPSKFAKRPYVAPPLAKCFGSKTTRFEKLRQTRQPGQIALIALPPSCFW